MLVLGQTLCIFNFVSLFSRLYRQDLYQMLACFSLMEREMNSCHTGGARIQGTSFFHQELQEHSILYQG